MTATTPVWAYGSLPNGFEVIDSTGDAEACVYVQSDGDAFAVTVLETGEIMGVTTDAFVAAAIEGATLLTYERITISDVSELLDGEEDGLAYPELVERGRHILAHLDERAARLRELV
jgi:hypothetical protein